MARTTKKKAASRKPWQMHPALLSLFFILGVVLHPFCIDFSERFLSPTQEGFLLLSSLGLTLLMFLCSKSHLLCSLLQTGGLLWNVAVYLIRNREQGAGILKQMNYEWCFQVLLMWCGGVTVTILIRLFAHKKWNAPHIRKTFRNGFRCSSIVFFLIYLILLLDLFIFQRSPSENRRSLTLIPFTGAFSTYWPHITSGRFKNGIFIQFFGNLLILMPLGFYLGLWWRKRKKKWILYLIPVLLAGTIEGCQYFFKIGECDIDDFWMNVVGFYLGILLLKALDAIRNKVSKGKEKTIFAL